MHSLQLGDLYVGDSRGVPLLCVINLVTLFELSIVKRNASRLPHVVHMPPN